MRRAGQLFDAIVSQQNLRIACGKALCGKRDRPEARRFVTNLEQELDRLATGLLQNDYALGRCRQFVVHDPKERLITAPCFAERVLHHAIMNVCEPVFERWLIDDTYACRVGRGRLKALARAQQFAAENSWFLKLDMRKYFDSIPHVPLLARLTRLIKDQRVLKLFARIVGSFQGDAGRGLPIGSLTSQHLANFYLGAFDRFVKESLRVRGYVRYMDDCGLWGPSASELHEILNASRKFLQQELSLQLKPEPYINRTSHGMDFLGCRVFPTHMTLNRRSRVRFRRKILAIEAELKAGELDEASAQQRQTAVVAFATAGNVASWHFRYGVLEQLLDSSREVARTG